MPSLEKTKQLWALFPPEAQDMTFEAFYKELCNMENPQKMQDDLMAIQLAKTRIDSNRLLVDRALHNGRK